MIFQVQSKQQVKLSLPLEVKQLRELKLKNGENLAPM